jgi:hypothetical protein
MTPSEIDPATFRFVAQCLNHCATSSVPQSKEKHLRISMSAVVEKDEAHF